MIAIDMEMPKSCFECPLTYSRWDFNIGCKCCKAIIGHHEEYGEYKTKRHPDCPLVEIVTCKDCKHYKHHGINGYCSKRVNTDSNIDVYREPDYFCALGEKRE